MSLSVWLPDDAEKITSMLNSALPAAAHDFYVEDEENVAYIKNVCDTLMREIAAEPRNTEGLVHGKRFSRREFETILRQHCPGLWENWFYDKVCNIFME